MAKKTATTAVLAAMCALLLCSACSNDGAATSIVSKEYPLRSAQENEAADADDASDADSAEQNEQDEPDSLTLYYLNGVEDLPYASLADWAELAHYANEDVRGYEMRLEADGDVASLLREYDSSMSFDAETDELLAVDYNGYVGTMPYSGAISIVPQADAADEDEAMLGSYFERGDGSYVRPGKDVAFDLASYDIDVVHQDDLFLVPLQTLNDLAPLRYGVSLLCNGEAVYIGATGEDLATAAAGAPEAERSQELADYTYNELCLLLDSFYGLKESHHIDAFDDVFERTGLDISLRSTNPQEAYDALQQVIAYVFDDIHSTPVAASYLCGPDYLSDFDFYEESEAFADSDRQEDLYKSARKESYPEDVPFYEEIGDTAFVTFDEFGAPETDLRELAETGFEGASDTYSIICYAHSQITRENSPIKNVVLDLSCNTGGDASAAVFTLAWMLGTANVSITDTFTEAIWVDSAHADVNLDGKFDESDSVADLNLYCLTSPVSFSCGNLVPWVLKMSNNVTLVGRTSGGGSCVVGNALTADGSAFTFSSRARLNYVKNGSTYDIDKGADPDVYLSSPASFYDRAALAQYLEELR